MALINHAKKEVVFKVVYCGPGMGGKTTNLEYIHSRIRGDQRGDLVSLSTSTDRTMFFDFLPVNAPLANGYQSKFQLYTVPGQVMYNATRQLVLKGVDGLVFVADSLPDRLEENVRAFRTMENNIERNQGSLTNIPLILQYNKRDLPGVVPVAQLEAVLNGGPRKLPAYEAVAKDGYQVFAVLNAVSQFLLERFYRVSGAGGGATSASPRRDGAGEERRAVVSGPESVSAAQGLAR
ncbi:MAG: GTPase domain-containing protein [Verrucomicrobiota bacterium]